MISYQTLYDAYDKEYNENMTKARKREPQSIMEMYRSLPNAQTKTTGFTRMANVRKALMVIDQNGWERSYHQKQFHDMFLRACTRVFWKTEPEGQFARDHQKILQLNGWDHLCQEILISTPRRCVF